MPECLSVFAALLAQVARLLDQPFEHQKIQSKVLFQQFAFIPQSIAEPKPIAWRIHGDSTFCVTLSWNLA